MGLESEQGRRAARLVPLGVQGAADAFGLLRVAAVDLDVGVPVEEARFTTGDCDWFHPQHCPERIGLADEVAVVEALAVLHRHF